MFVGILEKNNDYFYYHPNMKGTFINLKDYEGYKNNNLMPYNEKRIIDVIYHGFRKEHRTIKDGKYPLFNKFINNEFSNNDELKYTIFECITYEYKKHIKYNRPLIHYINESGKKTGAMEINIPLDFIFNKKMDYKLMLIFNYNEEKKYYEPKTIVNHQAVFTKALNFEAFDTLILTDKYLNKIKNNNEDIDKMYLESKEKDKDKGRSL